MTDTIKFTDVKTYLRIDGPENNAALARLCVGLHFANFEQINGKNLNEIRELKLPATDQNVVALNKAYCIPISLPALNPQAVKNLEAAATVLSELSAKGDRVKFLEAQKRLTSKDFWINEYKECLASGREHIDVVRDMATREIYAQVDPRTIRQSGIAAEVRP